MRAAAIIFDLDGTLLDSLEDLSNAANHAISALGRPTHTAEEYRQMVGYGADVLLGRALGPGHEALAPQAIPLFVSYYEQHAMQHTTIYQGVPELLDELTRRQIPMAILSNKPQAATSRVVGQMLGRWPWRMVAGHRPGVPKKPDPTPALQIAEQLGVDPAVCTLLGDSQPDMQIAVRAGMTGIGATWGFRSRRQLLDAGARRLIDHPAELLEVLNGAS